ncbi:SHOCT domain-containing protein [Sulfurirhabdus autotrophica]|uniref:Putative membrane protein n=1 Tax=Sulfurirhabdus autotrophica TaxID=1706046 RepID=A0A4R3YAM9_9PROT|nr:SHOCT domain-containing protein [Sulfurirhabdus autotrophica]TCV87433.1 putative membrane protein [Sulfurirhabdus autotrophica]
MYGWDHGGWMFGGSGGWMFFGWLWMALVWLIPVLLLFALVKYLFSVRPGNENKSLDRTALNILDEKYARGELTREEYLQKRNDLKMP